MMMQQLTHYLDKAHIDYHSHRHSVAYTAQQIAEQCKVNGMSFAKTVMVIVDAKLAMIVMPAPFTIDFNEIANAIGCEHILLAYEHQFRNAFPDCETGAMPPFGNLFDMPVYIASALSKQEHICFNAGDHRQIMEMKFTDFEQLVHPTILSSGFHQPGSKYDHMHVRQGKLKH